jgi:hypothetical protein
MITDEPDRSVPAATEALSGIVCGTLTEADRAELRDAAEALLDARGLVVRITEILAGGIEQIAGDLRVRALVRVQSRMRAVIERALWHSYRVATFGLSRGSTRPWSRTRRIAASASGAMSGAVGLPGLLVDIPFTTGMMLRAIAEIARAHGEDIKSPETRRACIEVFTLGGIPREDSDAEVSYWTARAALNQATLNTTIQQAARLIAVPLSQKMLAQAVPVAGALAGGALNYVFMDYFQQIARVHFAVRAVERRTGDPDAVRACLHEAVQALRQRRAAPQGN